jgi:hypothetical protein
MRIALAATHYVTLILIDQAQDGIRNNHRDSEKDMRKKHSSENDMHKNQELTCRTDVERWINMGGLFHALT